MRSRPRIAKGGPTRLLARDFALDINDPEASSLTDDQLMVVYVAHVLEEMFAERDLKPSKRNLLLRLLQEVAGSGIDDQDRRFFRATNEIEERVASIDARATPRKVTTADALALLIALENLRFPVQDRCQSKLRRVAGLLRLCEPATPRRRGKIGAAGVLARILFSAGSGVGSIEGFVKKINSAVTREAARQRRR